MDILCNIENSNYFIIFRNGTAIGDHLLITCVLILIFTTIEWMGREGKYGIEKYSNNWNKTNKWIFYYLIVLSIFIYSTNQQEFIYFQF